MCMLAFTFSQAAAEEVKNWPKKIEKNGGEIGEERIKIRKLAVNVAPGSTAVTRMP